MKVGDIVKYGKWYTGRPVIGLIIDKDSNDGEDLFFLVVWNGRHEWEDSCELEIVSESR